jgi:hypothetical protein
MVTRLRVEPPFNNCDSHDSQHYFLVSGITDICGILMYPKMAIEGHPAMLEAERPYF